MRIHTDLNERDIRAAAIVAGVSFTRFETHGSRKRARAFDVILTGSSTRKQNGGDEYAATWDEWGVFLGVLYVADPMMNATYYENAEHFEWSTCGRFNGDEPFTHCPNHKWAFAGEPCAFECTKCGATKRHGKWSDIGSVPARADVRPVLVDLYPPGTFYSYGQAQAPARPMSRQVPNQHFAGYESNGAYERRYLAGV